MCYVGSAKLFFSLFLKFPNKNPEEETSRKRSIRPRTLELKLESNYSRNKQKDEKNMGENIMLKRSNRMHVAR